MTPLPPAHDTCEPSPDDGAYAAVVSAWLAGAAKDLPPERLLVLLEKAVDAIWGRANWSVGAVSLIAIVDRAITLSAERWPPLARLHVDATGVYFQDLRKHLGEATAGEVSEWMQLLLTQILSIIGMLTTDMLTGALQRALQPVTLHVGDIPQQRLWPALSDPLEGSDA